MATSDLPRDDIVKELRELRRRLAVVEQRDTLANTGLTVPGAGEVDVNGLLRVLGNLIVSGQATVDAAGGIQSSNYVPGTSGWRFDGQALEVNQGLVGKNAMPLQVDSAYASTTGTYGLTTSYATLATATATVPSGFTQLAADVKVSVYAINNNSTGGSDSTGSDAIYARAMVNGNTSSSSPESISGSNGYKTAASFGTFTLSGLSGGATVSLSVQGKTALQSFTLNANNFARISATLIWTR